ncbi:bifunctional 4-hydroxy-2-oxoglutarate aldolase/2-dehydro-3-deoxy-phosphogluconate aldolase [Echinicola shivajiensis]|uniref:bifunctional 4-hydroxy-2-oxoglutarate aldolase/2-dehydro-3-deoxy-phosphogluconate aldolase n=1 Tax=Echinicola shivajiensis TaxID=1035916 RepID=UPI001BFC2D76|nr:bifunctional 4-hydroxy-2-oxoglutarate aldolase/2-dehydro-3-deoxy-phosphogluconate aldolase [Echinicola shivajiensis]
MSREAIRDIILKEKLIAIVRTKAQKDVPTIVEGLVAGGIRVLEITSNTPGFDLLIKENRKQYPDVLIGAGTVTNASIAEKAIKAGAQFLVSPNTQAELVNIAHDNHIPIIMGALTPTEIGDAVDLGADIVKLFPASNFGSSYLKAIRGPFDEAKFFAVGGIDLYNMCEWLDAGALGLGLGSVLTAIKKEELSKGNIESMARAFVEKLNTYHGRS